MSKDTPWKPRSTRNCKRQLRTGNFKGKKQVPHPSALCADELRMTTKGKGNGKGQATVTVTGVAKAKATATAEGMPKGAKSQDEVEGLRQTRPYFRRAPTGTSSAKMHSTGLPSAVDAARSIPFDSTPRSLRGARLATTTILRPTSSSG